MQVLRYFCLLAFSISFIFASGQTSGPNSREPDKKRSYYSPQRSTAKKLRKAKVTHSKEYEYYERVEKAAKEKQRILKKLGTSQYSDPRHFGHKRIPRRKPPYKMRYCSECGIRH